MSLSITLGPMNSGKTTDLLDEATRINAVGLKVLFINHLMDTRSTGQVSTHNPLITYHEKLPDTTFIKISHLGLLYGKQIDRSETTPDIDALNAKALKGVDFKQFHTILVDEGQFFEDIFEDVEYLLHKTGKNVRVAGLSGDYRRKPIGNILNLISLCDNPSANIRFKMSYCTRCAREKDSAEHAPFSYRLVKAERKGMFLVGGAKLYEPLCGVHYDRAIEGLVEDCAETTEESIELLSRQLLKLQQLLKYQRSNKL